MSRRDDRGERERPTADEMLARLAGDKSADAGGDQRGRMRVYLGMAPGVGKTYRMLEEAHRRQTRGTDVIVAYVEAHGRPATEGLLADLEIIPRRRVEYRGVVVEEMDVEAVIARHPEVAFVDELAHTNAPGSGRAKRWQDVEAIRDAGIEVVSTCNIQHLDSVADAVATITGAPVNERLPDEVLADAEEVELVDMSPRALRQRMRHGNVYAPDRARVALDRFFTEPNLTALRELSLRFVTGRVDAQLDGVGGTALNASAAVTERVMVLVDDRPVARRALRRAAGLAAALRAPLLALVVQTPIDAVAPSERRRALREHLDDAADLGAQIVTVEAEDVAFAIVEVARARRVSQLVIGHRTAGSMERLRQGTLVDRILASWPRLEIHVVADAPEVRDPYQVGRGD